MPQLPVLAKQLPVLPQIQASAKALVRVQDQQQVHSDADGFSALFHQMRSTQAGEPSPRVLKGAKPG